MSEELAKAYNDLVRHSRERLRRDVTAGQPGPTRGDNYLNRRIRRPRAKGLLNRCLIVGYNRAAHHVMTSLRCKTGEQITRRVVFRGACV